MALTRREFLSQVGQVGGYSAAFVMMQSLGLLPVPNAAGQATFDKLRPVSGKGVKVVILGGGIAGLVSAWELTRQGYACTLLEARERPGGRNWTVRKATKIEFTDGSTQSCDFDDGHYLNAGPARLPSIHQNMLTYCKELGVPLEVEVNSSRSSLLYGSRLNGGRAVEQRQMVNDTRGHVSELLAKCVKNGSLDKEVTKEDREQMIAFLTTYGDLDMDSLYKGSARSGYKTYPGAANQPGTLHDPLGMQELLDADLWEGLLAEDIVDWQATMFQPIGGMDQIPMAFARKLNDVVRYGSSVEQVRQSDKGVHVVYKDLRSGKNHTIDASYCICAMPLTIVKNLDINLDASVRAVIDGCTYASAYKIAWESPRFWEKQYNIYGGLSYLHDAPVEVVWYPSAGMFSDRGVIISGYSDEGGTAFGKLPNNNSKLAASRNSVELLHPGHGKDLTNPVYVNWGKIPNNLGSWISGYGGGDQGYQRLCDGDGRIFFAGDHVSKIVGWQEGAALAAHRAVNMIGMQLIKDGRNA